MAQSKPVHRKTTGKVEPARGLEKKPGLTDGLRGTPAGLRDALAKVTLTFTNGPHSRGRPPKPNGEEHLLTLTLDQDALGKPTKLVVYCGEKTFRYPLRTTNCHGADTVTLVVDTTPRSKRKETAGKG